MTVLFSDRSDGSSGMSAEIEGSAIDNNDLDDSRNPLNTRCVSSVLYEPPYENTNNVVSEQVQHKPSCTSTEDG